MERTGTSAPIPTSTDPTAPASGTTAPRLSVPVRDRAAALMDAVRALDEAGIPVEDVALRRPTLDEAFLSLTGRKA
jgi:ABC-2 type transport system ATP-binding protein